MKFDIELITEPNPAFAGIAGKIANGDPPEWLMRALEHFSRDICADIKPDPRVDKAIKEMRDATKTLLKYLPTYGYLGQGWQCPDEVLVVLGLLPKLKAELDKLSRPRPVGKQRDARRYLCAAVIVHAWELARGKAEPHSVALQEACKDYWRACGNKEIGKTDDIENWRRPVERAPDDLLTRRVLVQYSA